MSPAPALGLRRALLTSRGGRPSRQALGQTPLSAVCLFCSFSRRPATTTTALFQSRRKTLATPTRRLQSTESPVSSTPSSEAPLSDPRRELEGALLDLQIHAGNYVNLSRVQLALRNLKQKPGHESIRVAFLGMTNGSSEQQHTAKKLLRLVLADPLEPAGEWEAQLEAHDTSQPLIIRVGGPTDHIDKLSTAKGHVIPEISVSSHTLNQGNLEMLLMETPAAAVAQSATLYNSEQPYALEDTVLAPTVEIVTPGLTSTSVTPVSTPVHMALLVGDGVVGAASILALPILEGRDTIAAAVNFKQLSADDLPNCPITRLNVDAGAEGLALFRADVGNAMKFESLWTEANVASISEWLRANVLSPPAVSQEAATKPPVRNLIHSLLQNARTATEEAEARDLSASLTTGVSPEAVARLNRVLADWAQVAHEELQQQLDLAFASPAWQQLGWWKLFWRVDDVGMLSSEMLALRFLPESERGIIYLAGRVHEAGVAAAAAAAEELPMYSGPALSPSAAEVGSVVAKTGSSAAPQLDLGPAIVARWPTHIPFTRNYLQDKTVPALQALAQKLVFQSLSTASLTTVLAGLTYASALGGVYEAGSIAALGVVLSLRRLQKKWDGARAFWEGEVREEGRKAVRASEASVEEVLDRATRAPRGLLLEGGEVGRGVGQGEIERVRGIIERAEGALGRMK
ncbi:hypothetical protein B0T17DRAFT_604528 [Bombardia bombarda]|uniref:Mmc1 C-terminal domain-containing protein n=1 Tax=Bombardia bombarda TaxID=252184 RepID=A0AA39XJU8_9PEZI|nr:hypothetical protein B0T17DRAFT_604528 [Bombardia bombarda]